MGRTRSASGGSETASETCSPHVHCVIKNMLLHMQTAKAVKPGRQSHPTAAAGAAGGGLEGWLNGQTGST